MSRDPLIVLSEIQSAAMEILEFTNGMTKSAFLKNRMANKAVIRDLEIIGEASKSVPQPIRDAYPNIPWKNVCGLRDVLIHEYFRVDLDQVWLIIEKRMPAFLVDITSIIDSMPQAPLFPTGEKDAAADDRSDDGLSDDLPKGPHR